MAFASFIADCHQSFARKYYEERRTQLSHENEERIKRTVQTMKEGTGIGDEWRVQIGTDGA